MNELQDRVWANKVRQGFNVTDVPLELCYISAELTEFYHARESKSRPAMADELADVAIFIHGLASMVEVEVKIIGLSTDLWQASTYGLAKSITRFFKAWEAGHVEQFPRLLEAMLRETEMLALSHSIDLLPAMEAKIEHNETRHYRKTPNGHVEEK